MRHVSERRAFTVELPGDVWMGDAMHGPPVFDQAVTGNRPAQPVLLVLGGLVDKLLGQLAARHLALTHGWLPFGACFNAAVPLKKLLSSSLVMFAEGPKPLIAAYQEILEAAGARCSVISHGSMLSADAPEGPQLLLLGRSFVIAESFEAEPISPPHE